MHSARTSAYSKWPRHLKEEDRNVVTRKGAGRAVTLSSTRGLLEMLGARTAIGRLFTAGEWHPARNQVVIISHALFVKRFAADPAVIGHSILFDQRAYTLVGVLAADFKFSLGAGDVDAWTPLPPVDDTRRAQFQMLARLSPGVPIQSAQAYVAATAARLKRTVHPYEGPNGEDGGYRASAVSLHNQLMHDFRTGTLILMSAAALVLLIACVNAVSPGGRVSEREQTVSLRISVQLRIGRIRSAKTIHGSQRRLPGVIERLQFPDRRPIFW